MSFWLCWHTAVNAATLGVGPEESFRTLPDALAVAVDGDVIEVQPGTYGGPVLIGDRALEIVSVGGSAVTTVTGTDDFLAVVVVTGAAPTTLRGFTLDGEDRIGGLFVRDADLYAEDLQFRNGIGLGFAELSVEDSKLTLVGSGFEASPAAIGPHGSVFGSEAVFDGVLFHGAHAEVSGGSMYVESSSVTFRGCTFSDNVSGLDAGALLVSSPGGETTTFEDTAFLRNTAAGYGSAVLQSGGAVVVVRSTFEDNVGRGAVNLSDGQAFSFVDSMVATNSSPVGGAGISLYNVVDSEIRGSSFVENTTDEAGGAIVVAGQSATTRISGNRLCDNQAASGGAILLDSYESLVATVDHNVFVANRAIDTGGAVAVTRATVTLAQNTLVDSSTAAALGAVWVGFAGNVTLTGNAIVNSAGGAILLDPYAGPVETAWNLLFDNDPVPSGLPEDPTTVGSEPGFVGHVPGDCGSDLRPAEHSALRDAGDPASFDDDGTRSDIGAYGGPGASLVVDVDGDGVVAGDCAPFDPNQTAAGDEVPADGIDQDCDGEDLCWVDADGDGTGGATTGGGPLGCVAAGVASVTGDCDDADPARIADCGPSVAGGDGEEMPPMWFCATGGRLESVWWLVCLVGLRVRRSVGPGRAR